MRTGLLRRYGKKDTVQVYIDVVIRYFRLPPEVRDTALDMFNYLAKNTSPRGLAPSMQAMTLVKLAAERKGRRIKAKDWENLASYNTLLEHSRDFDKALDIWQETKVSAVAADIKRVIIPPNFTNPKLEINYFMPRFVKVLKGQDVEWVNLDTNSHHLRFYEVLDNDAELLFECKFELTRDIRGLTSTLSFVIFMTIWTLKHSIDRYFLSRNIICKEVTTPTTNVLKPSARLSSY